MVITYADYTVTIWCLSFNMVYYLFSIECIAYIDQVKRKYMATMDLHQLFNQNRNSMGMTTTIQIKICAEYQDMLPKTRLVCQEPEWAEANRLNEAQVYLKNSAEVWVTCPGILHRF